MAHANYSKNMSSKDTGNSLEGGSSTDFNASNQFEKSSRNFSESKGIRDTPKYHDIESYVGQRHHFIGTGVFNADELDDLPPRYRTKVLNAYEKAAADLAVRYPQANTTVSHLLAIDDKSSSFKSVPPNRSFESHVSRDSSLSRGSQNFRGRRGNNRDSFNRPNCPHDSNVQNTCESSSHSTYSNQNHLNRNNSIRNKPKAHSLSNDKYTESERKPSCDSESNRQGVSYQHEPSSRDMSNNFQKPKHKEIFHNYNKGDVSQNSVQQVNHKKADMTKSTIIPSDRQSVQSSEQILPTPESGMNIPNKHSKQTFRNENHRRCRTPESQNSEADKKQDGYGSKSRNNSFKSVKERNNTFSDITQSKNSKECSDVTKIKYSDINSFKNNSEFRSGNIHENKHSRSKSKTSVSSDTSSHGNNRFRNTPCSDPPFVKPLKDFSDRKVKANVSNGSSSVFPPSNIKGTNYHNKNSSDDNKGGVSNPRFPSLVKKQNSNRNRRSEVASFDPTNMFNTENHIQSTSKNSSNSDRNFASRNLSKAFNVSTANSLNDSGNTLSKQSKTIGDDSMKSVLDVINNKESSYKEHYVSNPDLPKHSKDLSKYPQNESENQKFKAIHKNADDPKFNTTTSTNQASNSRYGNKNSFQRKNNSESGSDNKGRYNSKCNISNHTNQSSNSNYGEKSYSLLRENSESGSDNFHRDKIQNQNSDSSCRFSADRTYEKSVSCKQREGSNSQSNANSKRVHTNSASDSYSRSDCSNNSPSKVRSDRLFKNRKQTERADVSNKSTGLEKYTSSVSENSSNLILKAANDKQKNCKEEHLGPVHTLNRCKEQGFFIYVNVSESSNELEIWQKFFVNALKHNKFVLDYCCQFTESLILNFEQKVDANKAVYTLKKLKQRTKDIQKPHLILVGNVRTHLIRPCDCQDKMVESSLLYIKEFSEKYIREHQTKIIEIEDELKALKRTKQRKFIKEHKLSLEEALRTLEDMERVFKKYVKSLEMTLEPDPENDTEDIPKKLNVCKLKSNFSRECNSFKRGLPIYSRKDDILDLVRYHSVTVISAETGSGKSTQLTEYLLQSWVAEKGTIICTQPRKIAAVSLTNYVCGQIGTAVGKLIGYDVGTERKFDKETKIIYMTDYALLKKILRNRRLKGISCVIIDEAHERTLYTDLLLGMLKECLKPESNRFDLRVVITSATIDPAVFVRYFNCSKNAVIDVPGRAYPVDVVWLENNIEIGWDYVKMCVKTAVKIHTDEPKGDILVFLTSPIEIDEAILMFKDLYSNSQMPLLMSLHGKSDLQEQMLIFQTTPNTSRKIIFATNAAETSLTIPGVKYVIDCGMVKEMMYFPEKNKNCLMVTFINKSSAEQRKGRAGRTQPGVCYRMYSIKNFEEMPDRACPEILRTNLQKALLKIYEFGLKPERFDFVESPSKEAIAKSLESLEFLGLLENGNLTDLGKKAVELPVDPRLAKLVLHGITAGIGYEMIIIAAMVCEAGRLFFRTEDIKVLADQKKINFCQETGDLCTYLEVYKRWCEVASSEKYNWCVENFISSKALNSAVKTIREILISLHMELSIRVLRRYNNSTFKSHYESIIFNCFSENLCIFSGHPKVGYFSPYIKDSLYIHPSSSLYYLGKDLPRFLVYSTLMQTTRNFLMDVTPIKEGMLNKSYQLGSFKLQADMLKCLQILPKTLGPFGDLVLRNHIIGRGGSKIVNLELMIEKLTNSRNFKIDVLRDKGMIVVYLEKRFHEKISGHLHDMVKEAHHSLSKEEDIIKMSSGFSYFCLGSGGIINDIIMPGEFREVVVENLHKTQKKKVEISLESFGKIQAIRTVDTKQNILIAATYAKVEDAVKAKQKLSEQKLNVKSKIFVQENSDKTLPIYRIQLSWSRSLSEGTGWVEFDSEADCIAASGCLTTSSFYIGHNYIRFTPSRSSVKQLDMRNLPPVIDEGVIEEKLSVALPDLIKVKSMYIKRKKLLSVTESEALQVNKKLGIQFSRFTAPSKMIIDVNRPKSSDPMWHAVVYFENPEDGERALKELDGKLNIDSFSVQLNAIRKSHLFCKSYVFKAVKDEIHRLQRECSNTVFSFNSKYEDITVDVGFSCKTMEDLFAVRQKLIRLLQGCTIQCLGNKNFSHLFTMTGEHLVFQIQQRTKTFITVDAVRKVISIYGPKENCARAEIEIRLLVKKEVSSNKKVFNLKNSCMPTGFLKCLYIKYGIALQGLISDYDLNIAVLDAVKGTLTIEGPSANLKRVEEHLEEICTDLYNKHQTVKSDDSREVCAVCLDPLSFDFYRLEHCGHAFCKECLLLQVESKTVPLVCIKQDCGKEFFTVDIKNLLSRGGETLRKNFYAAALQYHVNSNIGKVSYCSTPDCHMIYRVSSEGIELQCSGCENIICTHCQTPYHYGMSCHMFKSCLEDEDYSLKVWMEENIHLRKQCPTCKAVIEKESGCNHMECINCKTHMCWLCLEVFSTDKLVYDHQPYCPKNQTAN